MALFRGYSNYPARDIDAKKYYRSNTKLQAGTHDSPGEKFLVDPRLQNLFQYHFGGDGWVVIPKGRIVAPATKGDQYGNGILVDGMMKDQDTGFKKPVLTIANGGKDVTRKNKKNDDYTSKANKPIGVAYGNIYEEIALGFNGMQPTIENEIYVELPLFENETIAKEVEWGSAYGDLNPGDFVMSDDNGRFIKADLDAQYVILDLEGKKTDPADVDVLKVAQATAAIAKMQEQIIGQVWAVEKIDFNNKQNAIEGWLKWVGWSEEDMRQDDKNINNSGFRASDIAAQDGFPGYPYEWTYNNVDFATNKFQPKGIPGLTDGSNIEVSFDEQVIGEIKSGQGGRYDFRLKNLPAISGSVKINGKAEGEELSIAGTTFIVDYINAELGLVVLKLKEGSSNPTSDAQVKASYKATSQIPGVPTNLDFKGSVGAVRILLQK
jgi:hypothetical protein